MVSICFFVWLTIRNDKWIKRKVIKNPFRNFIGKEICRLLWWTFFLLSLITHSFIVVNFKSGERFLNFYVMGWEKANLVNSVGRWFKRLLPSSWKLVWIQMNFKLKPLSLTKLQKGKKRVSQKHLSTQIRFLISAENLAFERELKWTRDASKSTSKLFP